MSVDSKVAESVVSHHDGCGRELEPMRQRVAELEAEVEQLRAALRSRQQIGLITGVLVEQFGLTPEQAWLVLRRLSSLTNLKVRDVARLLIAGYFGQLADEDLELAARLNEQLPSRSRLKLS